MSPERRFSKETAHHALMDVAVNLLHDTDVAGRPIHVPLSRVIERSDVPRASAYRIYGTGTRTAQQHFDDEIAIEVVRRHTPPDPLRLRAVLEQLPAEGANDDAAMTGLLDTAIDLLVDDVGDQLRHQPTAAPFAAVIAALPTRDDTDDDRLVAEVASREQRSISAWSTILGDLATTAGIRPRAPRDYADVAGVIANLSDGQFGVAASAGDSQATARFAALVKACIAAWFEPDPRHTASAQPQQLP